MKKLLITLIIMLLIATSVSALTKQEVENAFSSIESADLIIDAEYGQLKLFYGCNGEFPPPPSNDDEWDKSSIQVSGQCDKKNAVFTIFNSGEIHGGDMQGPSEYRIYLNDLLIDMGQFQLVGHESIIISVPGECGKLRLNADQRPEHPGKSQPNAIVEDCNCKNNKPPKNSITGYTILGYEPNYCDKDNDGYYPDDINFIKKIICKVFFGKKPGDLNDENQATTPISEILKPVDNYYKNNPKSKVDKKIESFESKPNKVKPPKKGGGGGGTPAKKEVDDNEISEEEETHKENIESTEEDIIIKTPSIISEYEQEEIDVCPDFEKTMEVVNQINKISFTKFLVTFTIESIDPELPLISVYEDHYTLNDFRVALGSYEWFSNVCPDLARYRAVLNENEIKHYITEECEGDCFALTPGFWKNKICPSLPQSFSDEVVDGYLETIRATSTYFSDLEYREEACEILKTNNPLKERAKKFFLADLFNYVSGGLTLDTEINSPYTTATNIQEVFQEMDYILINEISEEYERIGNLGDDIASGTATDCSHEWQDQTCSCNCETRITTYGPIKCVVDRIIFHVHKWINQAPTHPVKRIIHGIIKTIALSFLDSAYLEETFEIIDLDNNHLDLDARIEIEQEFVDYILSADPYSIPPPGIYSGQAILNDPIIRDFNVIINPTENPYSVYNCFLSIPGFCGNGILETGEECDDGNVEIGDGCDNFCRIEDTNPVCGNDILEEGEECDDGNLVNGDGCSSTCTIELPPEPICGNGVLEVDEECDDGNLINGDGCSDICLIEESEECGKCEGKVNRLRLRYTSGVTAQIRVVQRKGEVAFEETISPGEEFEFFGLDKKNTLGTEIEIYINNVLNTKIHTSCSQPIEIGMIFGNFEIKDGYSKEGGKLCRYRYQN